MEQEKQERIKKFYQQLEESRDLADNLQELTKFLHEFTGATGVYVGKLEHPRIKIEDKDNDKAHINREAAKEIKFIHASPEDHKYMISKVLKPQQGLSHEAFNSPAQEPPVDAAPAEGEGEGEEGQKAVPK